MFSRKAKHLDITSWASTRHVSGNITGALPAALCAPARHYSVCTRAHLEIDDLRQSWWLFTRLMGNKITYAPSLILTGRCRPAWQPSNLINSPAFWRFIHSKKPGTAVAVAAIFYLFPRWAMYHKPAPCKAVNNQIKTPGMHSFDSGKETEVN